MPRVENAVLIICSSVPKIKELAVVFRKSRKSSRDFNMPAENGNLTMEYNMGFRSLHSRNNSESKGKSSIRVPYIPDTTYETDSISRQDGGRSSSQLLSCPPKPANHNHSCCQHPRQHRRNFSDSISFKSFPSPKNHGKTASYRKQSAPERTLSRPNSCSDFLTSPQLTSRTVISAGDGPRIPISLSLPASGRTSGEESRRGDISPRSPSFPFTATETCDSPSDYNNPLCILKTDNFTVEYEDTNDEEAQHNLSQDVDLGWTTMRNQNSKVAGGDPFSESDADGLQLQDVGSILKHSQDQV